MEQDAQRIEGHVELSHGKVHYLLEGNPKGQPVVCVHGVGGGLWMWKFLSEHLAVTDNYRVLSFDLYGHGESTNPHHKKFDDHLLVEQVLELVTHKEIEFASTEEDRKHIIPSTGPSAPASLGSHTSDETDEADKDSNNEKKKKRKKRRKSAEAKISHDEDQERSLKSFILIGHSMGGGISVAFSSKYPALVQRLVLIAPAGAPFALPFGSGLVKLPFIGIKVFEGYYDENKVYLNSFYDHEGSKEMIDWYQEQVVSSKSKEIFPSVFVNCFKHFPLQALDKEMQMVGKHHRKTFILWGKYDILVPISCLDVYRKHFPNSNYVLIDNTRHCPFLERHETVNGEIAKFLRGELDGSSETPEEEVPLV